MRDPEHDQAMGGGRAFSSTAWSVVQQAQTENPVRRLEAVDRLANIYWKPIYWSLRWNWNAGSEEARDLTQDYFAMVLEKDLFANVDRERGTFRAYVKATLKNFVLGKRRAEGAQKRGGGHRIVALDDLERIEAAGGNREEKPEEVFDRQLARSYVEHALEDLAAESAQLGKSAHFELFRTYYLGEFTGERIVYRDLEERFSLGPHEVKNRLSEMRLRFREALLNLLGDGVSRRSDLMLEAQELFKT